MADKTPSLYLDGVAFHPTYVHTAHFGQHTEIALQDIPKSDYMLRLFVEDKKSKLQTEDSRTWTLVGQRVYVLFPHEVHSLNRVRV